jgi:hypothetical protein
MARVRLKTNGEAKPSRLVFGETWHWHRFGGPPVHRGVIPKRGKLPLHHVLTLDLTDPLVPTVCTGRGVRLLPFYFALNYGVEDCTAQYRVVSDSSIEILHVGRARRKDNSAAVVDMLPERPFSLVPLTYEEYRALILMEKGGGLPLSKSDHAQLRVIGYPNFARFGGETGSGSGNDRVKCQNSKCRAFRKPVEANWFARIAGHASRKKEHSMEDSQTELNAGLCKDCGTIITVANRTS